MPTWNKVIVSGSTASLDTLNVVNSITASAVSASNFIGTITSASYAVTASYALNAASSTGGAAGGVTVDNYTFVGNGTTTQFQVSKSYSDTAVLVSVAGLNAIIPDDYSISASTITFVEAPQSQSNIAIKAFVNTTNSITGSFSGSFIGNGSGLFNITASSLSGSARVEGIIEKVNITASAPPATFNVDLTSGSIFFRSASSTANWTTNFRGNSTLTLNNMITAGESITATILTINGATPYSASSYQIDGATIIPRWQGGISGSASSGSLDAHLFTIIKIASASYQVLGSITRYA